MANYTVNKVELIGYIGGTPELMHGQTGKPYTQLSLATHDLAEQGDGTWKRTNTVWHRVVCFGKTAESAAKFLKTGKKIRVEGRISYSNFTRDDGSKGYSASIIASEIGYL